MSVDIPSFTPGKKDLVIKGKYYRMVIATYTFLEGIDLALRLLRKAQKLRTYSKKRTI